MAMTLMTNIGNLIYPGIQLIFNKAMKRPRVLQYKPLVMERTVRDYYGYYETMGNLGPAQVFVEGNSINYDRIRHNNRTTITAQVIAKGVQGTMQAMHFDLYDEIKKNFGAPILDTLINKKERIVADQYNDSFSTTAADGKYVVDDDHPLLESALVNNNLASGELLPDNIMDAKNQFNFIYDQAGEFFPTRPTHLAVHPNKMYRVLAILNSNLMALELSNTKNTLQDYQPIKVITNQYFDYNTTTEVSPWFLLDKTLEAGCVLQKSKGIELNTRWDWDNLTYKGVAYEIYNAGFIAPGYGIVGSPGS